MENNFAYKIVKQMTEKDRHSRPAFPQIISELRVFLEKVPDNQEVRRISISSWQHIRCYFPNETIDFYVLKERVTVLYLFSTSNF